MSRVVAMLFLMCAQPSRGVIAPQRVEHSGAVEIQMRNVNFRLARDIVLEVRSLRGRLVPTKADLPVTFDDSASFYVDVDSAEIAISAASLTALMNSYVLNTGGSPIRHVVVTIEGNRLVQEGTIHKKIDLPFKIEGSLSATNDGDIRMHAEKINAAHVPVKGLLHVFGEDLSNFMKEYPGRGMKIDGDDVILMPRALTPAPHLEGRVTRVRVADGKIVQTFDSGRHPATLRPPIRAFAYIYHRGGVLRFGKLTMNDADLEIVGDRRGVFEFFQREYQKQLIAGYSKNTASNGLVAHMVDYSRVRSRGN